MRDVSFSNLECFENSSGSCVASWVNVFVFNRIVAPSQPREARSTTADSEWDDGVQLKLKASSSLRQVGESG